MSTNPVEAIIRHISTQLHEDPARMKAEQIGITFFNKISFWRAGIFDSFPPNIRVIAYDGAKVYNISDDGFAEICRIDKVTVGNAEALIKYLKFYFWATDSGDVLSRADDIGGISDEHLEKWKGQIYPPKAQWSHLGGQAFLWLWHNTILYSLDCKIEPSGRITIKKQERDKNIGVNITIE